MLKWRAKEILEQMLKCPRFIVPKGWKRWSYVARRILYNLATLQAGVLIYFIVRITIVGLYQTVKNMRAWDKDPTQQYPIFVIILILPLPMIITSLFSPLNYDRFFIFTSICQIILGSILVGVCSLKILETLKNPLFVINYQSKILT